MRLTLLYIGTATEGRIALLLSMRRHGYPVSSPVSLISMTPIIPAKTQAPLYIREGAAIPNPDGNSEYIVPPGGLILDMCEYTELVGNLSLLDGLPDWVDLLEAIISLEVMCYYRPQGIPASLLAQQIGAMVGVPRFGSLLFPPVAGFSMQEGEAGAIAECDGAEGFCCISKYMWLLKYLPPPIATMYHPFAYDGGFWLPSNAPEFRYNLWSKPYVGIFGSQIIRYDWIVAHDDKHRDVVTGEIASTTWSGALYQSHGYLASLTSASGRDMTYGGYRFTIEGAIGTWLSAYAYIHEAVTVAGLSTSPNKIIAAPPAGLHGYSMRKPLRRMVLQNQRALQSQMVGKLGKMAPGSTFLLDENKNIITDEEGGGIMQ